MASKASLADQQKQVQENIHSQIKDFCAFMDDILLPVKTTPGEAHESSNQIKSAPRRSGLSFAIGSNGILPNNYPAVPKTKQLRLTEVSHSLKEHLGYSLVLESSQIPHKDAGLGLFLEGEADVGAVIAVYPGLIYSPAYYRYIPGYPRIDAQNPYLITRYDGIVINAQPWGKGSDTRELWDGRSRSRSGPPPPDLGNTPETSGTTTTTTTTDRLWKALSKPLESKPKPEEGEILERRNPLAFAHFANHPAKGTLPNVMVCPYDFPLAEKDLRPYIPNLVFGDEGGTAVVKMKRFGSFWFKSGGSAPEIISPVLRTLVLVATRAICNEEIFLNYRLSNSKRRPKWYTPVDEEEDKRRWG
ncbi:hypothetical protein Dimus_010051 [Dionaea muscipula]